MHVSADLKIKASSFIATLNGAITPQDSDALDTCGH